MSFIGISNWALDPAKMNRGVMVTRGAPDVKELEYSAEGICGKGATNSVKTSLKPFFKPLAEAYEAICGKQKREFFGLRDFYRYQYSSMLISLTLCACARVTVVEYVSVCVCICLLPC